MHGASLTSSTMCGQPTYAVSDMKSWLASVKQPITMSVSNVVPSQKRKQKAIRQSFNEMGYDGNAIEFDRYEESYPTLMRIKRYK